MWRYRRHRPFHDDPQRGYFPPMISIEEEVKVLEKMKETLEKRLEIVNKRLEVLKPAVAST